MAGKPRSEIISDIETHIAKNGGAWGDWFVGVTDRPKQALFKQHGLRPTGDAWISRRALDELQAGEIEEFFRTVRKTKGRQMRIGPDSTYVYAYRCKPHTNP